MISERRTALPSRGKPRLLALSDEYETPDSLYRQRAARFRFTLDAAAAPWNAKCPQYFTKRQNALKQRWPGRVWLNPPYSRGNLLLFVGEARYQVLHRVAELVDCLVPASTCERWFQEQVLAPNGELREMRYQATDLGVATTYVWRHLVVEVLFVAGRLRFRERDAGQLHSARSSHALVTFIDPRSVHASGATRG